MHEVELVLALLIVLSVVATLAQPLRIPYPILLVLVGLGLGLIPQMPSVELEPDLVFLLFLPPLLYFAAFNTSIREVRAELRPILSLAVGLVLATTAAVAVIAHALIPELDWPTAFVLGAIVSPPDAVAATSIFRGLGVPRRLVTVLEGESLFNDATALVAYRAALAITATATFSFWTTGVRFLAVGAGGVLVGLVAGYAIAWLRRRLDDPPVEIAISLLTPFAAYVPAEWLHVSGVLAAVTAGMYVGRQAPYIMTPETRIRGRAVWDMVVFVMNGLVFILIGLQLPGILSELSSRSTLSLAGLGVTMSLVVILVRFAWLAGDSLLKRAMRRTSSADDHPPAWPEVIVAGWAGMRGVVSLAAALALPAGTPERDLVIFLTFCVILATLVGQGLSLPWLIHAFGVADDGAGVEQERVARSSATDAAVLRIEQLALEWPDHSPLIESLRLQYAHRVSHFEEVAASRDGASGTAEQEMLEHSLIRRAVIDTERAIVLELRDRGEISDEVRRRIERDLDLDELRVDA
ncbi:hypothetical protein AYO38_01460 [bacterium SCGC AG-212-C10]|nr:hypothetical protein AYO38_01460 [bacterium SCGC AG-212-C10]